MAMQDRLNALASLLHGGGGAIAQGQFAAQQGGRHQGPGFHHMEIGRGGIHGLGLAVLLLKIKPP
jgi:hypothetical protein